MQQRPVCFNRRCGATIGRDDELFFEAPCGHHDCPSASFHGVCLMEWREYRDDRLAELKRFIEKHIPPGGEHG